MLAWVSTFVEMTEVGVVILGGASRAQSLRDDATRRPVMPVTVSWHLAPTRVYAVLGKQKSSRVYAVLGKQKIHELAECWAKKGPVRKRRALLAFGGRDTGPVKSECGKNIQFKVALSIKFFNL